MRLNAFAHAASAVPYGLLELLGIRRELFVLKGRFQVCDKGFEFWPCVFDKPVVDTVSSTAISDQARPLHVCEVAGDIGLGHSEHVLDVTAAQLPREQQIHDSQAVYVREAFEITFHISHIFFRALTDGDDTPIMPYELQSMRLYA